MSQTQSFYCELENVSPKSIALYSYCMLTIGFWKHQYVSHCTFIESLLCTNQKVLKDGDRKIKKAGAGFSTEELSREGKTDED